MRKTYRFSFLSWAVLCFIYYQNTNAQNLVPNPGFEIQDTCPKVSEIWLAPPWNSPTLGSPDLFNTNCNSQQGTPRTGSGSAGFFTFSDFPDNREYIQVKLTSPMVAGQTYCVQFYTKRNSFFTYAIDKVGAYFNTDSVYVFTTSALSSLTPQIEHAAGPITGTNYVLISGSFVASGGEQWMVIGNFRDDANTDTVNVEHNANIAAYNYVDDINVYECGGTGLDLVEHNKVNITAYPNPASDNLFIIFKGIPSGDLSVTLVNALGQQVMNGVEGVYESGKLTLTLNVSNLQPGIYFVNARSENNTYTKKIMVK